MTNEAILDILNHLCNEARNSVHATFGVIELLPAAADPTWQTYLDISRSSADRLLRCIDDFRDLLSTTPPPAEAVEEFDVALCLGETIELLNLASGNPAAHVLLEAPAEPLPVRQNRQSVEQVLTRILATVLKLSHSSDVCVSLSVDPDGNGVRFSITPPDSALAIRLLDWLNADPEQVSFRDLPEMPLPVAVMVAGKRLRFLGGSARIVCQPGAPASLAICLPSLSTQNWERRHREVRASSLNVLVTEDCDDSYSVSELLLRKENVWRARDGREAIEMVKKQRFDIVLMDIHMPGMDGYTVIQAIRDWETQTGNARTPIVVLSSDDLETQRHSAARSGCTGFLRKPLRNHDLLDLLDRLKGSRSLID
jgi:CheY-like chemotaxis protein